MQRHNSLYIFCGLIASGKSTLAKGFASRHNIAYYNSDILRKELAGLDPTTKRSESVDQGIYSAEFTRKTYDALLAGAEKQLAAGKSAILDASYSSRAERRKVCDLAKNHAVRVYFVLCTCPEDEMKKRLAQRAADPAAVSDGRWEIYCTQKERFEFPDELPAGTLITISTDGRIDDLLDSLESALNEAKR